MAHKENGALTRDEISRLPQSLRIAHDDKRWSEMTSDTYSRSGRRIPMIEVSEKFSDGY